MGPCKCEDRRKKDSKLRCSGSDHLHHISGTSTETDPYRVVTNEETQEKFHFALDVIFLMISVIVSKLMISLPHNLTLYQRFDALFHVAEFYISNEHENRLLEVYSQEAVDTVNRWMPVLKH